uniref:Uncharacterized protein n=1 Tax=Kalanchoe fedtschenkoi TaxID=63787 RepID=A0A7N1A5D2_KALFE
MCAFMAVTATTSTPSRGALRLRFGGWPFRGPPRTTNYPSSLHSPCRKTILKLEKRYSSNNESNGVFDEGAFEAERLKLDAQARQSMADTFKNVMTAEESTDEDPKAWKWTIRKRVWDLMEALNIAQNPRPVHHRIPNFVGAQAAAKKVSPL